MEQAICKTPTEVAALQKKLQRWYIDLDMGIPDSHTPCVIIYSKTETGWGNPSVEWDYFTIDRLDYLKGRLLAAD